MICGYAKGIQKMSKFNLRSNVVKLHKHFNSRYVHIVLIRDGVKTLCRAIFSKFKLIYTTKIITYLVFFPLSVILHGCIIAQISYSSKPTFSIYKNKNKYIYKKYQATKKPPKRLFLANRENISTFVSFTVTLFTN